jgi:UDP-N-acetylmuramoylalanine--D-glutamate ligase
VRWAELAGKQVAVWGYGREGRAALRALRERFPQQRPALICSEAEREVALLDFAGSPSAGEPGSPASGAMRHLVPTGEGGDLLAIIGGEPDAATLRRFDVIVKSPGVSAYKPALLEALAAGVAVTSGTALWFDARADAKVIAVTGTKGKSTTSSLIAHLLRSLGRRTALAGNIGLPLLELLEPPQDPHWWVVELSSFQTGEAGAVCVGVINNLYEEHLDWHVTRERYAADKLLLADRARTLVTNALQPELVTRTAQHAQRVLFGSRAGWHVAGGAIRRGEQRVFDLARLPLPGEHNALNACAALAAIEAGGEDAIAAATHLATFKPLPHRQQTLGERDGLTWINDSIATTPAATLEALHSLRGRAVCLLVGGFDRGLDWSAFADAVRVEPPHSIVCLGANGARIHALLLERGIDCTLARAEALVGALVQARTLTPPGGVVLLSPGAPSFDQFKDYAERGRCFAALAGFDPATIAGIEGLGIA